MVKVEPDLVKLIFKLPEVGAGFTFSHQVFMSMLSRNHGHYSYVYAILLIFVLKCLGLVLGWEYKQDNLRKSLKKRLIIKRYSVV